MNQLSSTDKRAEDKIIEEKGKELKKLVEFKDSGNNFVYGQILEVDNQNQMIRLYIDGY